jgi:hypothetical protein
MPTRLSHDSGTTSEAVLIPLPSPMRHEHAADHAVTLLLPAKWLVTARHRWVLVRAPSGADDRGLLRFPRRRRPRGQPGRRIAGRPVGAGAGRPALPAGCRRLEAYGPDRRRELPAAGADRRPRRRRRGRGRPGARMLPGGRGDVERPVDRPGGGRRAVRRAAAGLPGARASRAGPHRRRLRPALARARDAAADRARRGGARNEDRKHRARRRRQPAPAHHHAARRRGGQGAGPAGVQVHHRRRHRARRNRDRRARGWTAQDGRAAGRGRAHRPRHAPGGCGMPIPTAPRDLQKRPRLRSVRVLPGDRGSRAAGVGFSSRWRGWWGSRASG